MRKPPKGIKIGPYTYSLYYDEKRLKQVGRKSFDLSKNEELAGHINHSTQQIGISPMLAPDCEVETVLHEITHGLVKMLKLEDKSVSDEYTVEMIAKGWLGIFRDNPALIRYLLELK